MLDVSSGTGKILYIKKKKKKMSQQDEGFNTFLRLKHKL